MGDKVSGAIDVGFLIVYRFLFGFFDRMLQIVKLSLDPCQAVAGSTQVIYFCRHLSVWLLTYVLAPNVTSQTIIRTWRSLGAEMSNSSGRYNLYTQRLDLSV